MGQVDGLVRDSSDNHYSAVEKEPQIAGSRGNSLQIKFRRRAVPKANPWWGLTMRIRELCAAGSTWILASSRAL